MTEKRLKADMSAIDVLDRVARIMRDTPEIQRHVMICYYGSVCQVTVFVDSKAQVRIALAAFGGKWDKNDPKDGDYDAQVANWTQNIGGHQVKISIARGVVCERVEIGRRTEKVPVTVTTGYEDRDVIDYAWNCAPILEGATK